jgi:D-sedoheptulose 7-phosphate isomerase
MKHTTTASAATTSDRSNKSVREFVPTDGIGRISAAINDTVHTLEGIAADTRLLEAISNISKRIIDAYARGNKVLLCGNGGSAADAQHIAAELSGRFFFDRPPLSAEALHANGSYVTAVANDYSFSEVFSRLVEAQGRPGDVLIALSTSGKSTNIIRAIEAANLKGMITVGITGQRPNGMERLCAFLLPVPSTITPRIQECHIAIGHAICETVERALFSKARPAVFVDRDGVINAKMSEGAYVTNWDQFVFLPNAIEAIRLLNEQGYLVIVVTNQQCIGKGEVAEEDVQSIHDRMISAMRNHGAHVDAVYVCPHTVRENCSCRKPRTGLIEKALLDLDKRGIVVDVKESYMVGDSDTDIMAGKKAGLKAIRVTENFDASKKSRGFGLFDSAKEIVRGGRKA